MPTPHQRVIIAHRAQRRIIHKPNTLDELIEAARARFDIPEDADLVLRWFPDLGSNASIRLSDDSMYCAVGDLTYITFSTMAQSVELDGSEDLASQSSSQCADEPGVALIERGHHCTSQVPPGHLVYSCANDNDVAMQKSRDGALIGLHVKTMTGKTARFVAHPCASVQMLKKAIQDREGIPVDQQLLVFAGQKMQDSMTLGFCGIKDQSIVHLLLTLRGAKPAIYLLSPVPLDNVGVSVTLSPQWSFTLLYPLAKPVPDKHNKSRVTWTVSGAGDNIIEHATGTHCSYLFWEAEALPPQKTVEEDDEKDDEKDDEEDCSQEDDFQYGGNTYPSGDGLVFNPTYPYLTCDYGTLLSFEEFVPLLDSILEEFRLTPAMRTEFIVYWLPSFQRIKNEGKLVAFRFVHQDAFARAAKIEVNGCPPPAAIARIFLLFGGVSATGKNDGWFHLASNPPSTRAEYHPSRHNYPHTIGFDVKSWDAKADKFRILEWGGMEVPDAMMN